ncbi:MAG: hypothetical protein JWR00_1885, partial [Rubritepida sp.]|nr:hypothetical protein [Rubritepida sp.]
MPDNLSPLPPLLGGLLARRSVPARQLRAPAPDRSVLDLAVSA